MNEMNKMNKENTSFKIKPFIGLFAIVLFTCFVLNSASTTLLCGRYFVTFVVLLICVLLFKKNNKFTDVSVIIGSGVVLRWIYILYTEVWERQHDVVAFGCGEGQAAYIEYFLTHRSFPDFDPRSIWGFFQPPLHHIISAIWMKISMALGCTENIAQENIQGLTFFYMSAMLIITYFICKELELKKWGMRVALIIVSFHPIYILLSGSINNDALSLLFSVLSIYLAIIWYKNPKIGTILLLGLSIGLAMFAKLSGYMVAPAVAALFLIKLIDNKDRIKKLLVQYLLFAVICVPIGLFWTTRNMVKFDMPINYIPVVGGQFEVDFASRLFDLRMSSVFPAMIENGDAYYEHNVLLAIFKTSLFGEYNYANESFVFSPICILLFIAAIVLAAFALYATVILLFSKKSPLKKEWKWMLGILYVTVMGSYLGFALSYSNFSAQDFRYAAIVIIVEAIILGMYIDGLVKGLFVDSADESTDENAEMKKIMSFPKTAIIIGTTAVFGACSALTYILLGIL